ncbi:hypothetical protein HDV00_009716 [Rhizophlyctis rosea]|nr:hypothetical protein HDV00_009716 [Rhizophlyctis rosea]
MTAPGYINTAGVHYYGNAARYEAVAASEAAIYSHALAQAHAWKTALMGVKSRNNESMYYSMGFEDRVVAANGSISVKENLVRGLETVWKLLQTIHTSIDPQFPKPLFTTMKSKLTNATFTTHHWPDDMRGAHERIPILGSMVFRDGVQGAGGVLSLALALRHFFVHTDKQQQQASRGVHEAVIDHNPATSTDDVKKNQVLLIFLGMCPLFLSTLCRTVRESPNVHHHIDYADFFYRRWH